MDDPSMISLKRARRPPKMLNAASSTHPNPKVSSSLPVIVTVQVSSSKPCMDGDRVKGGDKGFVLLPLPSLEVLSFVPAVDVSREKGSDLVRFGGVKPMWNKNVGESLTNDGGSGLLKGGGNSPFHPHSVLLDSGYPLPFMF